MEKLVFDLGIKKENIEAAKPFKWFCGDEKVNDMELPIFAKYRGHIINDNAILNEYAKIALNHIEFELNEILEAFRKKDYKNFEDLRFVYRKTDKGFIGKIFFYGINKPMRLYFESVGDELNMFVGGECVNGGYNKTYASVKTNIYNYMAVHALMGMFGLEMIINAKDDVIFVEYKFRDNRIYRLDILYKNSKFFGVKNGLSGVSIGHWSKANKWGLENSVELPSFGSYIS